MVFFINFLRKKASKSAEQTLRHRRLKILQTNPLKDLSHRQRKKKDLLRSHAVWVSYKIQHEYCIMLFSDSECADRVFIFVNPRVKCWFIVQRFLCSTQRGVTKQSNEVTRNRVRGKKIQSVKKLSIYHHSFCYTLPVGN